MSKAKYDKKEYAKRGLVLLAKRLQKKGTTTFQSSFTFLASCPHNTERLDQLSRDSNAVKEEENNVSSRSGNSKVSIAISRGVEARPPLENPSSMQISTVPPCLPPGQPQATEITPPLKQLQVQDSTSNGHANNNGNVQAPEAKSLSPLHTISVAPQPEGSKQLTQVGQRPPFRKAEANIGIAYYLYYRRINEDRDNKCRATDMQNQASTINSQELMHPSPP